MTIDQGGDERVRDVGGYDGGGYYTAEVVESSRSGERYGMTGPGRPRRCGVSLISSGGEELVVFALEPAEVVLNPEVRVLLAGQPGN